MNAKLLKLGGLVAIATIVAAVTVGWTWGAGGHQGQGQRGQGHESGGLVATAAAELGMSVEDVMTALHEGSTIAALAEQQGVDPATIVQAQMAAVEGRLAQAVEDGRITEEAVADRLAQAEERITERLEQTAPMGHGPGQMGRHGARGMGGRGMGGQGMGGHGFGQRLGPAGMGQGFAPGQGFGPGGGECLAEAPAV